MRRFFGRLLADDEPTAPVLLSGLRAAIPLGRENFIPAWSYHLGYAWSRSWVACAFLCLQPYRALAQASP